MKEWSLIKKIKGLNLEEKCFEVDEVTQSNHHEKKIPEFTEEIEEMGFEIFDIKGHQFITSDGVYRITHKSEIEGAE